MTNAQIIFNHSILLMQEGKLQGTGRMLTYTDDNGNDVQVEEPEEIHTFAAWKALGFSVKKGEHSDIKFPVWKYKASKDDAGEDEDGEKQSKGRMFLKVAAFFTAAQVEPLKA